MTPYATANPVMPRSRPPPGCARVIHYGHAMRLFSRNFHPAPAFTDAEAGEKGGKRASWLKTLILGYLLAQAGVDISNWVRRAP